MVFPNWEHVYQIDRPFFQLSAITSITADISEKVSQSSSFLNGKVVPNLGRLSSQTHQDDNRTRGRFFLSFCYRSACLLTLLLTLSLSATELLTMNRHTWLTPDTAQTHCFTLNWWKKCSFYPPLSTSPCLLQRKVEENTMHLLNVSEIRLCSASFVYTVRGVSLTGRRYDL